MSKLKKSFIALGIVTLLSGSVYYVATLDTTPPTGSIVINAENITSNPNITITITATDENGVSQMCISNTDPCSAWEPYAQTKVWALPAGNGLKTVYVWVKDNAGNITKSQAQVDLEQ